MSEPCKGPFGEMGQWFVGGWVLRGQGGRLELSYLFCDIGQLVSLVWASELVRKMEPPNL